MRQRIIIRTTLSATRTSLIAWRSSRRRSPSSARSFSTGSKSNRYNIGDKTVGICCGIRRPSSSDDLLAQRLGDGFGLRVNLQLFVDVADVEADGVEAYAELGGGGLVVVAFDQ